MTAMVKRAPYRFSKVLRCTK